MLHFANQQNFRRHAIFIYWQNVFAGWIRPAGRSSETAGINH